MTHREVIMSHHESLSVIISHHQSRSTINWDQQSTDLDNWLRSTGSILSRLVSLFGLFFWDQVQWNDTPYFQGCKWAQIWVGGSIWEAYKAFVMTETPVRNPFQRVFVWDRFFVIFWFLTHPNGSNCIRRQLFYHKPAIGYDLGSFSWFSEFSEKGSLIFCLPFYKLYSVLD